MTNRGIAQELNLSPKTVMHYLSAIYKRIGVRGRAAATAWAIRNGMPTPCRDERQKAGVAIF